VGARHAAPVHHVGAGCRLVRFSAQHPEPATVTTALAALGLDLPLSTGPAPALVAVVAGPRGSVELR
jgi:hypothetical protein